MFIMFLYSLYNITSIFFQETPGGKAMQENQTWTRPGDIISVVYDSDY